MELLETSTELTPKWQVVWIDKIDELEQVIIASQNEDYLAIDTETVGWQTGNEKLAILQIGIPSQKIAYIIDVLTIGSIKFIESIFTQTKPAKVAHNASFEERQLASIGIKMKGIRDTLPMSRNLRPDLPNHQLKTCCKYVLGVEMSKVEQTSDWGIRPLTDSQLKYAALDVELLSNLYEQLKVLEDKLSVNKQSSIEELMAELFAITQEKFELIKDIAPQLSYLEQRFDKIKESIKDKLVEGAPAYKGIYGEASIKLVTQTEINTQKVKDLFPQLVPMVVAEKVERKRLLDVMQEYGIDKKRLEEVLDPANSYHRLNLEVNS
jgi:ribonuclease D